ncbi:hypothetical protein FRZ67_10290 [Panacibacter ginsenosidivorans]|uniref:Uncharacterized protein n=1 Tax=Panacibacter ginsenosidivorans TaxID=1813871 RepID=A0A5B8V9X5_9BACT|nr:hypothetical protein [Panacibacter ginsenosidivorans]QEC67661.1 hypothetical protein FRZ67_10290 [Panacibacter ginsenosidivorans]
MASPVVSLTCTFGRRSGFYLSTIVVRVTHTTAKGNSRKLYNIIISFLFSPCKKSNEKTLSKDYTMNYIMEILDATFPFVEDLLTKPGEFYPLSSAVDNKDSVAFVGTYDGDENPESNTVIKDLKAGLKQGVERGDYKAIAIFYDVKVIDPDTNQKTDAIAVIVESKDEEDAYTFYYPYKLTKDKNLNYGDSWKTKKEKEIFIK